MTAKRYGVRPSSLMPEGYFPSEWTRTGFDTCIALKGQLEEIKAQQKAEAPRGVTTTRTQAFALAEQARAEVREMERAKFSRAH